MNASARRTTYVTSSTVRPLVTGGELSAGASGSSTTISVSAGMIHFGVCDMAQRMSPSSARKRGPSGFNRKPLDSRFRGNDGEFFTRTLDPKARGRLLFYEPRFLHQPAVDLVVRLEEVEHLLAAQEDRLQRLLLHVILVLRRLRHLLEEVDVERDDVGRHLARQEHGAQHEVL